MRLRFYAHYGSVGGYGRAARDYLAALDIAEIRVEIVSLDHQVTSPDERYRFLDQHVVGTLNDVDTDDRTQDVAIYHATPWVLETIVRERGLELGTTKSVALTTWETSRLPRVLDDALGEFDAMIVPSRFCAQALGGHVPHEGLPYEYRDGRDKSIYVVPHCFDGDEWQRLNPRRFEPGRAARFYTIGAWGERKNVLGLLRAYFHAFRRSDNVELLVLLDKKANFDEIQSLIARTGVAPSDLPKVTIPEPRMYSDHEILAIHSEADCFVTVTRAEGWGLGMFEAALVGNDVIAPKYGGQVDFLQIYDRVHWVPYSLTPCFGAEERERVASNNGHQMQISKVTIPRGVDCRQLWAEPDLESLAAQMRRVYVMTQTEQYYAHDYQPARRALESMFEYRVVGPRLLETLKDILR